jgi:hypothetical protein
MRNAILLILMASVLSFSGTKTAVVKTVLKPDTMMVIDTNYFVAIDTVKYTQKVSDTVITTVGKLDSTKVAGKPVQIKIKKAK